MKLEQVDQTDCFNQLEIEYNSSWKSLKPVEISGIRCVHWFANCAQFAQ